MPITFDTLNELKAFYRDFRLVELARKSAALDWIEESNDEAPARPRRGRPGRSPSNKVTVVTVPGKRGRKPKAVSEKVVRTPRAEKGETLTSKIQGSIQSFLDAGKSFTANDVYDDLSQRDNSVNKQSVITSVLKQMNSTYQQVAVTERAGNGPRPVKLYNP